MPRTRQLAAIMFTDIVGYTALMQQNEQNAVLVREKHRRVFNSVTEKHRGRVLQYYGDGTLSIFDSAIDAVECGIELQRGFREEPAIPVRIGIHSGDILFSEEDIIGDSVNVASRIESLAVAGSVLISDKVYDEVKNQEGIETVRLKAFKLKNVARPVDVYAIADRGLIVPDPDEITGKIDADGPSDRDSRDRLSKPGDQRDPILATKLYVPPPRPNAIHRARLIERMDRGRQGKLTLISAPAGFGKTTLVSDFVASKERRTAWLSLDPADGEPARFVKYLVAALQRVSAGLGEGVVRLLQSPEQPPVESILASLLNDLATVSDPFALVLDDYHVIDSGSVDEALGFLLDHMPPFIHVIITTREDPDLPLARLRVRGQLTELRAADLRFTHSEAAGFLNQVMGLDLSAANIEALEGRTEGWIAGLQLAALSMQGREDIPAFIEALSGHDRYIVDYLGDEVLERQPESVRSFMLQTSILTRLNGSLCDAVTTREDSRRMLEDLERSNLFVVPLDDNRQWYRFHHLFADVLQARAADEHPDLLPHLHTRASVWYARNGLTADAVRHALASENVERAAELIERAWPAMDGSFQSDIWLGWVRALPDEMVRARPVLCAGYGWALLDVGELETAEDRLRDAELWLEKLSGDPQADTFPDEMVVVDEEQFRSLPATIASARAYLAQTTGDIAGTVEYARRALDLVPEGDHLRRGLSAAILGLANWANGDLEEAHQAFAEGVSGFRLGGNILMSISATVGLALIQVTQGRLRDAIQTYRQSLERAAAVGESELRVSSSLHLALSELLVERGDRLAAEEHMQRSVELGAGAGLADWPYRKGLAEARLMEIQGDLDKALDLLQEAERQYYRNPMPDVRPISALRARIWIRQGRLADALDWARERGLSIENELTYLREFEHITLARLLIALYQHEARDESIRAAMVLLDRLLEAAEEGKRIGSMIEILVVQAIAHQTRGDISAALISLERALTLAEPEGFVRLFVDEGASMARLLAEASARGITPAYSRKLLAACEAEV